MLPIIKGTQRFIMSAGKVSLDKQFICTPFVLGLIEQAQKQLLA
jgi:hypothetical protein